MSVTWESALAWRLRRQLLDPVTSVTAAHVVGTLGAVATQLDPAAAELGVRARRLTGHAGDLERALAEGLLLKTFAFRGATHWMTPEAASVHLALRAASRMWERPAWQSYYDLSPADWPALRGAVREALTDGPMTRAELAAAVTGGSRFGHLAAAFTDPSATFLKPFAWQGDLSLGPARDGRMTLQRLDANPRWPGLPDVDEAGRRAVEAYVRAYGPASPANVQYWLGEGLGVRRSQIGSWLADGGARLCTVRVGTEDRLVLCEDVDDLAAARPTATVRLLPRYDQWVLGPGTADQHVVPASIRGEVSRGANLLVLAGVVAGTWSLDADTVVTSVVAGNGAPPGPALEAEVARLARALGRPLSLPVAG
ncbi:MAG: winged helix DNA-binding domain-containing protein [Cellulomonadaceae bacterium]|nr:winged helix DNA-binding domain-containing protein [Cellulomonadaceae bacterium]